MTAAATAVIEWGRQWPRLWNRFWFTPAASHTLAAIRIFTGAMLFYTHLVWTLGLAQFFGADSWVRVEIARRFYAGTWAWSYLWYVDSPAMLWTLHLAALVVFAMLTLGLFTRVVSVLAWVICVSYCHRLPGALFGLDQVNAMLAMYLMIAPAGAVYSLDRWLAARKSGQSVEPVPRVSTNVAIRLLQLHLCIIYLFSGVAKMRGVTWWDGTAIWFAVANLEYQSVDMTWLAGWPLFVAVLTHMTVVWETFYCALVWPRMSRPLVLATAAAVHIGIGAALGMITFGLAMLLANLAFVPPELTRAVVAKFARQSRAGQGSEQSPPEQGSRRRRRARTAP